MLPTQAGPRLAGRQVFRSTWPSFASGQLRRPNLVQRNLLATRRHASTKTSGGAGSSILDFFYGTTLVLGLGIIYVYVTDTRASVHRWIVIPALRTLYPDPEKAHEIGNKSLSSLWTFGIHPRERGDPDRAGDLEVEVFGHTLRNPIGTSAGIDKHADIPDPLFALGPAIIELGGVTPQPQPGNEKPRVFRLSSQNAMINRYGLNSEGADHIAGRLRHRVRQFANAIGIGHDSQAETEVLDGHAGVPPGSLIPGKLLAVNIAKNKTTPENDIDAVTKDYLYCAERVAPYTDIIVVNVSSPNTPGLRSLQNQESLTKILSSVVQAARSVQRTTKPAVMVKVSPDEDSDEQVAGICQAIWAADVDGVIVGNTTNRRPKQLPHLKQLTPLEEMSLLEQGGFSGPHLFEKTLSMVKRYKQLLGDKPPSESMPSTSSESIHTVVAKHKLPTAASDANESKSNNDQQSSGSSDPTSDKIQASIQTEVIPPKNISDKPDSEKQSLFQLPTERFYDAPQAEQDKLRATPDGEEVAPTKDIKPSSDPAATLPPARTPPAGAKQETGRRDQPKVIFATGGITNGQQALEILNAGASVAMVYTALVYGGVGTISRIKDEMRQSIAAQKDERKAKIQRK